MSEKRRFQRLDVNLPVGFKSQADDSPVSAATLNVSAGGLCLLSKERIPLGRKCQIKMETPEGEKFFLKAQTVWELEWPVLATTEYKIGLKLLEGFSPSIAAYAQFYFRKLREKEE